MRKIKRETIVSFRLPVRLLDEIEKIMEIYGLQSYSEFFRRSTMLSVEIESKKSTFTDPQKCKEFLAELNSKLTEEKVFDWVSSLSDTKIEGLKMALDLEKDKRYNKSVHSVSSL